MQRYLSGRLDSSAELSLNSSQHLSSVVAPRVSRRKARAWLIVLSSQPHALAAVRDWRFLLAFEPRVYGVGPVQTS